MRRAAIWLVLAASLAAVPVRADIGVASVAELAGALERAGPGETLLLAGGEYGPLTLTGARSPVTLRSADPMDPARFSGLELRGVQGITLEGLAFDYRFQPGDALWTAPFAVMDSQQVTLRDCRFAGDVAQGGPVADDGHATGIGLTVDRAADVLIEGNHFVTFYRGLVVSDSDRIAVVGNEVSGVRSDGMNFVADQGLLVADNFIHDFQTSALSGDHPDMIQFWTAGTTRPTQDVVIRDNVLHAGAGSWTQSILMGNEMIAQGQAGPEMRYRNITITGNVIVNAHLHGISLGEADGVRIAHNTLIHLAQADGEEDNPDLWTPRINLTPTSDNVTIEGNASAGIAGAEGRADWVLRDNVRIQDRDPAAAGYYDAVFVAAQTSAVGTLAPFTYLPGGPVDGITAGAARLIAPMPTDQVTALVRATRAADQPNRFTLDARFSTVPDGLPNPRYLWRLSDGATGEGAQITHDFTGYGAVEAQLTVQTAQGATAQSTAFLVVPDPELINFDGLTGTLRTGSGGALSGFAMVHPPGESGWALPIGKGLAIPQHAAQRLAGARDFDLQLRLQRTNSATPGGEILRLHPLLVLSWEENHGFALRLQMADGTGALLQSRTPRLEPGRWFDLAVQYDAATGMVILALDGKLVARTRTFGPLASAAGDLTLGNPFGQKSFDGLVSRLDLRANQTAYARP